MSNSNNSAKAAMCNVTNALYNIVHDGKAHRDDFLCACLAAAWNGKTIYRRELMQGELVSKRVLVMDVGGEYNPELNNYDHHQFDRNMPAVCALTLLLGAVGIEVFSKEMLEIVAVGDSKGPFELAKLLDITPKTLFALGSPIERALLKQFSEAAVIRPDEPLYVIMREIGTGLLDAARDRAEKLSTLREMVDVFEVVEDVWVIRVEGVDVMYLNEIRDEVAPTAAIRVSWDDRGEGWSLFRYEDNPRVDFSRLESHAEILFTHKGGFIAKTKTRLGDKALKALLQEALIPSASDWEYISKYQKLSDEFIEQHKDEGGINGKTQHDGYDGPNSYPESPRAIL